MAVSRQIIGCAWRRRGLRLRPVLLAIAAVSSLAVVVRALLIIAGA